MDNKTIQTQLRDFGIVANNQQSLETVSKQGRKKTPYDG